MLLRWRCGGDNGAGPSTLRRATDTTARRPRRYSSRPESLFVASRLLMERKACPGDRPLQMSLSTIIILAVTNLTYVQQGTCHGDHGNHGGRSVVHHLPSTGRPVTSGVGSCRRWCRDRDGAQARNEGRPAID